MGVRTIQPGTCETVGVRAIFIAPTKLKSFLHSTIHRGTLPQSRVRSTAPSEREPGLGCAIQRAARKPEGWRAIFIAPTGLRGGFFLPFSEVRVIIIALKNPFYHLATLNIKAQAFSEPVLFGYLIPLPCR